MIELNKMMKILIDPGHGGEDRGAVANGVEEAPINLSVAFQLYSLLCSVNDSVIEYDAELIRFNDDTLSWGYRRTREREYNPDLVLSIHCNSSTSPNEHGIRMFHWPGNEYAQDIAFIIEQAAPINLHGIRWPKAVDKKGYPRAYSLVAQYKAPVVLVEMGFISNAHDRDLLQDKGIQRSLVAAMFCGIVRGFKPQGKTESESGE